MISQTFFAPAKLNLGLKILNRRDDGYHNLASIFCLIDLYDQIEISISTDNQILILNHQQQWLIPDDLCYQAASILKLHSGFSGGAGINVKKNIPIGAGLGGGSSDAATVLLALNQLWGLNYSTADLIKIAATLGADIPFFIYGKNAYVTGIGDILQNFNIPQLYFVLVKPNFNISTKEIFKHLQLTNLNPNFNIINPQSLLNNQENDLATVAFKLYPQLFIIKQKMQNFAPVHMTGSGSTLYSTFTNYNDAKKVAQILEKDYNSYLVKSLSVSPIYLND